MHNFILFLAGCLGLWLFIYLILLPINIAKAKKIKDNDLSTIRVLTWISFISAGITWLIALFLATSYKQTKK